MSQASDELFTSSAVDEAKAVVKQITDRLPGCTNLATLRSPDSTRCSPPLRLSPLLRARHVAHILGSHRPLSSPTVAHILASLSTCSTDLPRCAPLPPP